MKKLLLIVLITLLSTATVQANWRHYVYWWDGIAHILHPSGDWWTCDKYAHRCKH
jgi:hypothetical protein